MKKKIVYISGADIFTAADVHAAFQEVRDTLKLSDDTILFGVPIDDVVSDSVAPDVPIAPKRTPARARPLRAAESVVKRPVSYDLTPGHTSDLCDDNVNKNESDVVLCDTMDKEPVPTPIDAATIINTPIADTNHIQDASVVPILSILGTNSESDAPTLADSTTEAIDSELELSDDINVNADSDDVSDVADIMNDDTPHDTNEDTLEQLLEKMTPLREDVHNSQLGGGDESIDETLDLDDESDATLENLASEFAQVQDQVPTTKRGAERGKIGKLKSILPFKKIKREDSGILGDLFGWADIAANDENFTNAASKK